MKEKSSVMDDESSSRIFSSRESCTLCSRLLTSITIATNSVWVLVWLVLSMVEEDVKDDVNL